MNIALVDFIDVSRMAAGLVLKHAVRFDDDTRRQMAPNSPHKDTRTILLRGPADLDGRQDPQPHWQADVPHEDQPLLADWPSARMVMEQVAVSHRRRTGLDPMFGKILIVSLRAGGIVDWHRDEGAYADVHDRFHLCLVPAYGAVLYSGGDAAIPAQGNLTYFNNHVQHSAVNFGTNERIHLIADIRKPGAIQ